MRSLLLLLPLLLGACHHRCALTARSEYVDPGYLASSKIQTPDPCRGCFTGQQIVISWNIAERCLPADLKLRIRYGTRQFKEVVYSLSSPRGYQIYRILNQDFYDLKGIMAYSAQIETKSGEIVGRWNHHLWADLVEIPGQDEVSLRLD